MNEFSRVVKYGRYRINFLTKQKRVLIGFGHWIIAVKNRNGNISRVDFNAPFSHWINAIEILKKTNPENGIVLHDNQLIKKLFPSKN